MPALGPPQIFEELMADKIVEVNLPVGAFRPLYSYLKVIKSRSKKLYQDLGFSYDDMQIKYEMTMTGPQEAPYHIKFWMEKPTPKATYKVVISDPVTNNDNN